MALCSVRGSNPGAGKGRRYTKWGQECSGSSASWQGPPSPTARERKPPRRLSARSTRTGGATAVPLQVPAGERTANDTAGSPRRLRSWQIACARGPASRSSPAPLPSPQSPSARPRRPRPPSRPAFPEQTVFTGLTNPTAVRFSPRTDVSSSRRRAAVIKVFDSLTDTTPTVFADLNVNVYNFWDRGLLGLALDPNFPTNPYVYVLYTYDHELGSTAPAPRWGTPGVYSDPCPTPPGPTADGCMVSGRLSRLQASGNVMTGSEQVLIEDWCQQYPSHSIGALDFGPDGALYVTGGDGASFNFADWGQDGAPLNPCGDPPGGVGAVLSPPTAEGGALRSQDLRTIGDPVSLDGALLRVDPATGAGLPDQPARRQRRSERAADHRLRPAQPVPVRRAARHQRGVDRRRRLEHLGGDQPRRLDRRTPWWRTSAGRVTRAPAGRAATTAANLNICENLYAQPQEPCKRPTTPGTTARWSCRAKPVRPAARPPPASPSGPRPATTRASTTERCSSPTTRATASGRCSPARTASPTRPEFAPSPRAPPTRWSSRSGPAATSSIPTSTAAPSAESPTPRQTSRRTPSPPPHPRPARRR